MNELKSYVIYSESTPSELEDFLSQEGAHIFEPIKAIESSFISIFNDPSLFFNLDKSKKNLGYEITNEEIAKTLSHIKCWKEIAKNENIKNNEFVLISESNAILVNDFYKLAAQYANIYRNYGIIKLQNRYKKNEDNFPENKKVSAIVYSNIENYNNSGSYCYLIRKDIVNTLIQKLDEQKPYWKSDYFTLFHKAGDIAQSNYYLANLSTKKNNSNPLFSVIVPVYNVEKYLDQCIKSVIEQTYNNFELILINDGSTDNSFDICVKYAKKHPNITLLSKNNSGVCDSRNQAIKIAKGEYIIFLDSDDYWLHNNALAEISELTTDKPDLILNYFTNVYPDKENEEYNPNWDNLTNDFRNDFSELYKRKMYLGFTVTKIIKKSIIIDNKLFFPIEQLYEDALFAFHLTPYISTYKVLKSQFYAYRRERAHSLTTTSVTTRNTDSLIKNIKSYQKVLPNIKNTHPELYDGLYNFLQDTLKFFLHCYNLMQKEEQEKALKDKEYVLSLIE